MRRIKSTNGFLFHLEPWEGVMLSSLLTQYPCLPPAHQQLSKVGHVPDPEDSQQLLEEALAEQRAENKEAVRKLLADPRHLRQFSTGWRLSLGAGEVDWLLQILNDIRVGSWVKLGSPEDLDAVRKRVRTAEVQAMELAGYFQVGLLHGLDSTAEGEAQS